MPKLYPRPGENGQAAAAGRATSSLTLKEVADAFGQSDRYGPLLSLEQAADWHTSHRAPSSAKSAKATSAAPTVGTIAACNVPEHRVRYVIETRGIEPSGRAGNTRVFTDADVDRVRAELARIDRGKHGKDV